MFTGFNIFSIALEVPITEIFPHGIPHNGELRPNSKNSLLRLHSGIYRRATQTVDAKNIITGLQASGPYVQVGRNALPLFNAGLVGTERQTLYLRSNPMLDVTNFDADILYPVLVRDAEALGIYTALGVPDAAVNTLKGRAPTSSTPSTSVARFRLPTAPPVTSSRWMPQSTRSSPTAGAWEAEQRRNRNQVNVNSGLISLIVAGNPTAGLAKGTEVNDKNYLD